MVADPCNECFHHNTSPGSRHRGKEEAANTNAKMIVGQMEASEEEKGEEGLSSNGAQATLKA